MSKGTKIKILNKYERVFYYNIGVYLEIINRHLSKKYKLTPLSEYIKIAGGYAFKSTDYKSKGVPIIRISDFNNEKIVLDNVKYYKEDPSLSKYEISEGDIIIAQTGGTIGKLAVTQKGLGKLYLNQRVGRFDVLNENDFEKEYVYWIARGVQDKIKNLAWGGAQPNVSGKQIESMVFPIPPKNIQKKIVNFLNDLRYEKIKKEEYFDKKIEDKIFKLQNKQIKIQVLGGIFIGQKEIITNLRQAILQDAIQGKLTEDWRKQNPDVEPASELLKKIKAEKEKLSKDPPSQSYGGTRKKIKKEKPLPPIKEEEIPFTLPKGWEWHRLLEVVLRIHYGFNASAKHDKDEVKLLRITDIQNNQVSWEKVPGCDYKKTDIDKYLLFNDDILIARTGGTIGKSYIVKNISVKALFASYLIRVMPASDISADYIKLFLESGFYWKQLYAAAWGAGQPNVNATSLSKLMLPIPSITEQKEIVKKVDQLMKMISDLEVQIQKNKTTADLLMQSVLREAFSK
jgi:restriction endonuclease S subunit